MVQTADPRLGNPEQTLFLIDISSFIFRAFFAVRPFSTKKGEPTNATYGVATMLNKLCLDAQAHHMVVVYDSKEPSFRKQMYTEYKANRSAPPDELIPQFDRIEQLISCLEIPSYRVSGVEADDIIGTLTKKWCALDPKHQVIIVSNDKDLMQLVNKNVRTWDTINNKVYGEAEVEEKFSVKPTQIRDYLALIGDTSDNIPGIKGVGPKTAVDLLKAHDDLDGVLAAAKAGKIPGKRGQTIADGEPDARLSATLATLRMDLDVDLSVANARYQFKVTDKCIDLLKELEFHSLLTRWSEPDMRSGQHVSAAVGHGRAEDPRDADSGEGAASPGAVRRALEFSMEDQIDAQGAARAPGPRKGHALTAGPLNAAGEERFRTILTEAELKAALQGIEKSGQFGFDLETTSLNPRAAEIVGVALCYDPEFAVYIPIGHAGAFDPLREKQLSRAAVLSALKPYLEDPRYKKVGQNLKYDWSVLRSQGIIPDGIGADTMVAAYVLEPEGRHNLTVLAAQHLGYEVMTYEQVCGKGKDQLCFDQIDIATATRYSAEDAWIAVKLWEVLRPRLAEEQLTEIFARVDLPLVDILSRMECQGVCVDEKWLAQLGQEFEKELKSIEERVQAYAKAPVNLNSTKQLAQLLFEELGLPPQSKTKTGFSTDASVLDALAPLHEVPRLLLEYREISKLKGTYVDPLPEMKDAKTGKIHAGFNQTVAATGRLSSADPNLQNIPVRTARGRKIRRAFVPSAGNVLLSADYSQIELRLLAHMSGDKELSASFQKGEDVHARTAAEIYSIDPTQVSDQQRAVAKAINFGLMYGKSAFALASELKISRGEAKDVINKYFERYSGVKHFLDQQIILAKEKGYSQTVLGRKRYLRDITSKNPMLRASAERMAMNAPIQGTAADLMKLAMIELDQKLTGGGYGAKLIIQVHDEFVLDCPVSEQKAVLELVKDVMEGAMKLSVPLRVNSSVGANWMDL